MFTAALLIALDGCQALHSERKAVSMANGLSNIQYRQVMDNLALMADNPGALPHFIETDSGKTLTQGTGTSGVGLTWTLFTTAMTPIFDKTLLSSVNPTATYQQQDIDEWDTTPSLDPIQELVMRALYLKALGACVPGPEAEAAEAFFTPNPPPPYNDPKVWAAMQALDKKLPPGLAWSLAGYKPEYTLALRQVYDQIGSGWVHVGRCCDAPKDACFVGRHCDTCVWVTRDGMESLTSLTIAILDVATTDTTAQSGKSSKQASPNAARAVITAPAP
jgi:hypothetical protein